MKKFIAFICAVVLTISTAVTAFALPSVVVTGIVTGIQKAVDANGKIVELIIRNLPDEYKEIVEEIKSQEKLKELLGDDYIEGMQVIDVKDVITVGDVTFPVTITFNVTGVTSNSKAILLHYDTNVKAWEKIPAEVGEGTVTATFNSLSPVAFVVDKDTAAAVNGTNGSGSTSTSGTTSPKTGETNVMMWAGMVAVAALAGMAVTYRRRKDA